MLSQKYPSANSYPLFHSISPFQPKKKRSPRTLIFIHHTVCPSKDTFFSLYIFIIYLCGWLLVSWSEFFRERKKERNFFPLPSFSLSHLVFIYYPFYLFSHLFTFFLPIPFLSLFIFSLNYSLRVCFYMTRKMKGVVGMEDAKARMKHQNLLQDYKELQKETEAKRKRLQHVKDRKLTLLAEVRFLRQRYEFLMKNRSLNSLAKREIVPPPKFETPRKKVTKSKKSYNGKETVPRPPIGAVRLNQKGRIYNVKEVAAQKPVPIIDLNQSERVFSGKESASRKVLPAIDLNQTANEEEDFQANGDVVRSEDPNKVLLKGPFSEQQNDLKLSVCRNVGNGSNLASKRKISWQDQMALRV